jgi:tRNA nucleotidyltransferase (CCA-adding enzyme)
MCHLAIGHQDPDFDAVGSLIAAWYLYRQQGVDLILGFSGSPDRSVRRFWEEHQADLPKLLPDHTLLPLLESHLQLGNLVVVDTARPARLGAYARLIERFQSIIAWDTHPPTPDDLPRATIPPAGSCTAALVEALHRTGIQPSATAATLMLLGIHADTGHFTFGSTSALDHRGAGHCLEWGADPTKVARFLPRGFTSNQLELLSRLATAAHVAKDACVELTISALELDEFADDAASLVAALREAESWPALVALMASGNKVHVIGRSTGEIDVGGLMRALGGGGHAAAASAILTGLGLSDARRLVLETARDVLGGARKARDRMVANFVWAYEDNSVAEIADLLHRHRLNAVPLCTRSEPPIWTSQINRQELDAAQRHGLGARPAREVAGDAPGWVSPDLDLIRVRDVMLRGRGRIWLVGENGRAEGLLTRTTVLRASLEPTLAPKRGIPQASLIRGLIRQGLGPLWPIVEEAGKLAVSSGFGLHMVGGAVRDLLLERPAQDVDLVVDGPGGAPAFAAVLADKLGGTYLAHPAFLTAKWYPPNGKPTIDLATARSERYVGRAHLPEVSPAALEQDLFRRDFTVNAMAVAMRSDQLGNLVDPYGGWTDLKDGILRVLHGLSFQDDPTRAFRAARFCARFDLRLAPGTRALLQGALQSGAFRLLGIERLGHELERILREALPEPALVLLRDWNLTSLIHPKLEVDRSFLHRLRSVRDQRVEGLSADDSSALWLVFADALPPEARPGLLRLVPTDRHGQRRFVESPEKIRHVMSRLARARTAGGAGLALSSLDKVEQRTLFGLARAERPEADRTQQWIDWWITEGAGLVPMISGQDLVAAGYPPGPTFKPALVAAQRVAWERGDRKSQMQAAIETLTGPNTTGDDDSPQ